RRYLSDFSYLRGKIPQRRKKAKTIPIRSTISSPLGEEGKESRPEGL
uniref:Uncharacterized protein n=1 Tax=Cucumis melo TaxID=3656 RepID=A0A9I9E9L7_CUCME